MVIFPLKSVENLKFADMKALNAITVLLLTVSAVFFLNSCNESSYVAITGYAQGGTYLVKVNTDGTVDGPEVMKHRIDSILNVVDFSVSGYNKKSILSRFNAGETVVPDEVFIDIYAKARDIWKETDGVVDVASAPLFDLWGFGFTTDSLPSEDEVARVLSTSGMGRLVPDLERVIEEDGTLTPSALLADQSSKVLPKLNYNAIAQGYSVDLVAEYLYSTGVVDMLINIGGEMFCDGVNPSGKPWALGIDRPEDGNNVTGQKLEVTFSSEGGPCGIVTSGNYRKFYVKDGRKYAHTIDPRTGYPVSHTLLSATIIAEDSTLADGLATCCMVIGLEEAAAMIEGRDDLEGCLIYDEDGEMKTWTSSGFHVLDTTSR